MKQSFFLSHIPTFPHSLLTVTPVPLTLFVRHVSPALKTHCPQQVPWKDAAVCDHRYQQPGKLEGAAAAPDSHASAVETLAFSFFFLVNSTQVWLR